ADVAESADLGRAFERAPEPPWVDLEDVGGHGVDRSMLTTETITRQTGAIPVAFHAVGQAQPGSTDVKNGPFIGFVASLLVLIAVALWQFSVLTSDVRVGSKPESGPFDSNQDKPARSPH